MDILDLMVTKSADGLTRREAEALAEKIGFGVVREG